MPQRVRQPSNDGTGTVAPVVERERSVSTRRTQLATVLPHT
ncbi:hypothetical protein [Candidatus Sodalis endolongispinus]|nr:hypothetical protein [Candidatus Sodalis endolongispinus]